MGSPRNAALREVPPDSSTEWLNFDHPHRGDNRIASAQDGRVELLSPDGKTERKKFALVGFSSASRNMAPLNDPDWAIVIMNQLQRHLRHATLTEDGEAQHDADGKLLTELRHGDLHFEMHSEWNTALVPDTDYEKWLKECEIPSYMTDLHEGLPHAVRFPIERLIEKFGLDYFTSTVAYMVAWAIDHIDGLVQKRLDAEGKPPDRDVLAALYAEYSIGIYGIDLVVAEEYEDQRPCAEYWIGQAMARNIEMVIPRQSALLTQHYRYGYQVEVDGMIRASDMAKRHAEVSAAHRSADERAIEIHGRIQELREASDDAEDREKRLAELEEEHQSVSMTAVISKGQLGELDYWMKFHALRERGASME